MLSTLDRSRIRGALAGWARRAAATRRPATALLLAATLAQAAQARGPDAARTARRLAADYAGFLLRGTGEASSLDDLLAAAEGQGFTKISSYLVLHGTASPGVPLDWHEVEGGRVLWVDRGRAAVLAVLGQEPPSAGVTLLAARLHTPHLAVRSSPLYEASHFAMIQTLPHGDLRLSQWAGRPLLLHARLERGAGEDPAEVRIGDDPGEPILVIPDAPSVGDGAAGGAGGPAPDEIPRGDPILGHLEAEVGGVLAMARTRLREDWGVERRTFLEGEVGLYPADAPRDAGLDGTLLAGCGQAGRAGAWCGLRALVDIESPPRKTTVLYVVVDDAFGPITSDPAPANDLTRVLGKLLDLEEPGRGAVRVRAALRRSIAVEVGTFDAIDPLRPAARGASTASALGEGIVVRRYTRANPEDELFASLRAMLERDGVPWQIHPRLGARARPGTLADFLGRQGMDVLEIGIPLLSRNAPLEVLAKEDLLTLVETLGSLAATGLEGT